MNTKFEMTNITINSIDCKYAISAKTKFLCAPEYILGYVENDIQCYESDIV